MKQEEHELIVRILNGDEQCYGVLIDRYKEGLYRHCFRFMRNEDAAEDIAQRAFIQAYVKLNDFDRIHEFSTWLYKIATNIALGELRKRRSLPLDENILANLESNQKGVEQQAVYDELYRAIDYLPENQKQAVTLHYFKGQKYEQIAKEMNTTPGSVKGLMHRAKKQLKEMLS